MNTTHEQQLHDLVDQLVAESRVEIQQLKDEIKQLRANNERMQKELRGYHGWSIEED